MIETIAGNGRFGAGGDGWALWASLAAPTGVAVEEDGSVLIADSENHRVRKVDATGHITTVAGTGSVGFSGDGSVALRARLNRPLSVAAGHNQSMVIADSGNNRVRIVSHGVIRTAIGSSRFGAYAGDGRGASHARLRTPSGATFTESGLLVADTDNNVVRLVARTHRALLLAILRRSIRTRQYQPAHLAIRVSQRADILVRVRRKGRVVETRAVTLGPGVRRVLLPPQPVGRYVAQIVARNGGHDVATDRGLITWMHP